MAKAILMNGQLKKVKTYSLQASTNEEAMHVCWASSLVITKVDGRIELTDANTLKPVWHTSYVQSFEKIPAGFGLQVVIIKTNNSTYVLKERM